MPMRAVAWYMICGTLDTVWDKNWMDIEMISTRMNVRLLQATI